MSVLCERDFVCVCMASAQCQWHLGATSTASVAQCVRLMYTLVLVLTLHWHGDDTLQVMLTLYWHMTDTPQLVLTQGWHYMRCWHCTFLPFVTICHFLLLFVTCHLLLFVCHLLLRLVTSVTFIVNFWALFVTFCHFCVKFFTFCQLLSTFVTFCHLLSLFVNFWSLFVTF